MALTDNTGVLRLYANLDEGEGKELVKANDVMPSSLRASVDGSKLALCRDGKVLVVDVKTGTSLELDTTGTDSSFDPKNAEALAVVDITSKQLSLAEGVCWFWCGRPHFEIAVLPADREDSKPNSSRGRQPPLPVRLAT